jgi:hypothetical protein
MFRDGDRRNPYCVFLIFKLDFGLVTRSHDAEWMPLDHLVQVYLAPLTKPHMRKLYSGTAQHSTTQQSSAIEQRQGTTGSRSRIKIKDYAASLVD